ncbi:MAG: hypothetical protein H8E35_07590, partial [Ardenticatenia bacterium]|nr:hypothetical protein [Ardenticatenia bacterium]
MADHDVPGIVEGLAGESLATLKNAPEEIRRRVALEVADRLYIAARLDRLEVAEKLVEVERMLLGTVDPSHNEQLRELRERLAAGEQERWRRVRQRVVELRTQATLEDLRLAKQLADELLSTIPEGVAERAEIKGLRDRIDEQLERKETEGKRREAKEAEQEGDQLSKSLNQDNLNRAVVRYADAEQLYGEAGDEDGVRRVARSTEKAQQTLQQLQEIVTAIKKADGLLDSIDHLLDARLYDEARRSPNMVEVCGVLRQLLENHGHIEAVQGLRTRALAKARAIEWTGGEFWALVQPPVLDWTEGVLASPPPSDLDEKWLTKIETALSASDEGADVTLHKDLRDQMQRWLREACNELLATKAKGNYAEALAKAPLVVHLHKAVRRLGRVSPEDASRASVTARSPDGERSTVAQPRTAEELMAWLDARLPEQALPDLSKWLLQEARESESMLGGETLTTKVDEIAKRVGRIETILSDVRGSIGPERHRIWQVGTALGALVSVVFLSLWGLGVRAPWVQTPTPTPLTPFVVTPVTPIGTPIIETPTGTPIIETPTDTTTVETPTGTPIIETPPITPAVETLTATPIYEPTKETVSPNKVVISGPTTGVVQVGSTFTATASPVTATRPITFTWQATGQRSETHTGDFSSDTVTFTWSMTGIQAITVTTANAGGMVTSTYSVIIYAPPGDITITGPITGTADTPYEFTAAVRPPMTTTPITYSWQAAMQTEVTHTGNSSDTVTFTWPMTGTQAITVAAANTWGMVTGTHTLIVTMPMTGEIKGATIRS